MRRSLVCSTLALGLALAPSLPVLAATATVAEPEGDPEALSAEAVEKFQAKEYDAAVELFEQAYAADPQPNYLFNIGRVYEEKGDLENAVEFYQRFVGQSGVDLESRQAATERLKVLRETLKAMKGDEEGGDGGDEPPPDDKTDEQTPPEDDGLPEDTTPPDPGPEDEAAAKRKKLLRITGYSLMGVGGAGIIVGAVLGSMASGTVDEANADPYVDRKLALRSRARRQAIGADAMFITGGVFIAAGVGLVVATVVGNKGAKGGDTVARRTMWEPVVGPRQVGLGLTHRF